MFNRKYLFKWWIFQRVMLVFMGVYGKTKMTSLILIRQIALMAKRPSLRSGCFLLSTLSDMLFRERSSLRHLCHRNIVLSQVLPNARLKRTQTRTRADWVSSTGTASATAVSCIQIVQLPEMSKPFSDMNSKKTNGNCFIQISKAINMIQENAIKPWGKFVPKP